MLIGYLYVAVLTVLTVISLRTLNLLDKKTPWTIFGWAFTVCYDCTASEEIIGHTHLPLHLPYWFLAGLIVAFVVAGIRDEPQPEPWWWPRRIGPSRAQRASRP